MYARFPNRDATDVSWIPSASRPSTARGTGAKVRGVKKAGAVSFTVDVVGMPAFRCEGLIRARLLETPLLTAYAAFGNLMWRLQF